MTTPFIALGQVRPAYQVEQDWLFEKFQRKLDMQMNLILTADRGWGLQEYISELEFQLTEKYPDIHSCHMNMKLVKDQDSFLGLFAEALSREFQEVNDFQEKNSGSMELLKLPAMVARRRKIRIALFVANAHLLHRFRGQTSFLRTLKLKLRNQKNCVFCLYGNTNQEFLGLVQYPAPLCGLGQHFHLNHDPSDHRSASIRRLFRDHHKYISFSTSVRMSHLVDNHPIYLRLLAWHALIRTGHTCTLDIVEHALNDLVLHFDHLFHRIEENLTPLQLNFLKALMEGNLKPYSRSVREIYQLGTTSNISRVIISLERKEIIGTGQNNIYFTDPVFRQWLLRRYYAAR